MCEKDIFYPRTKRRIQLVKVHPSIFVLLLEKGCLPTFPTGIPFIFTLGTSFFVVLESIASRPFAYR